MASKILIVIPTHFLVDLVHLKEATSNQGLIMQIMR